MDGKNITDKEEESEDTRNMVGILQQKVRENETRHVGGREEDKEGHALYRKKRW